MISDSNVRVKFLEDDHDSLKSKKEIYKHKYTINTYSDANILQP